MTKTRRAQDKRDAFQLQGRDGRRVSDTQNEIAHLVSEAALEVASGNFASALWRLTDAAGLCSRLVLNRKGLIGWDVNTGRGYKLSSIRTEDKDASD